MATVDKVLRVVPGFRGDERDELVGVLEPGLDRRLERWDDDQVEMELSVKERDGVQQRVVLEAWVATRGSTHFVATSEDQDLQRAVAEVRDELRRQIDRFVTKGEDARRG